MLKIIEQALITQTLQRHSVTDKVALLGVRGFFSNKNERNLYDDAIHLSSPTCRILFRANCDPSLFKKGIASLSPGVWRYKVGTHGVSRPKEQQYIALVQAEPVTVERDEGKAETGFFGINIHKGGWRQTGSEGCQTIHPEDWFAFLECVRMQLRYYAQGTIPYVLVNDE